VNIELLNEDELPDGFTYPNALCKIVELGLVNLDVWYFMTKEQVIVRQKGLKERYPNRRLLPFARRGDNDDIACFEIGQGEKVFVIHDFASSGYEQRQIFNCVWDWFKYAIDIMIDYD